MVLAIHNIKSNFSLYQTAIAGGAAGAFTRAVAQPLDVLKIRFQLQLEPLKNGSKYSSIMQATTSIIKEEGIGALWSGHIPAQFLSITFGVIQFSTFEKLTYMYQRSDPQYYNIHKHWINFVNGAVAAAVATVVSYPFDTVRTRLIAEEKRHKVYKGFFDASATMIRQEGFTALFKGLVPTLGQIAPNAGIQFAVYKLFSNNILNRIKFFQRSDVDMFRTIETSLLGNLLAGSLAGLVAKTAIYPFDLVKKRLQIQGFQQHRKCFGRQMYCNGVMHCVKLTITEEGFLALYKGYGPSMLKAVLTSALHFAVYDEIKSLLLKIHQ
ncbi:mitochondrial thiamine pyrophosphate carrier [Amyelois transitella]|uniref:mitochondrial thiamine pyrophosphate carrier n=1 Tax=Amyelois transitella TaxID=680683 RepID=UPI00298F8A1F|nr:mitochondrial thiamine pyrophosphate carrier [Amyelois transitella]